MESHLFRAYGGKFMSRISAVLFLALLFGVPAGAQPVVFGVNTKFEQGATGPAFIARIGEVGVRVNRDALSWGRVETMRGRYALRSDAIAIFTALRAQGIRTDIILTTRNPLYDGGDFPTSPAAVGAFARFAAYAARTLGDQAEVFEIGNEFRPTPTARGMPNYADYVTLFVAAAEAIHAVRPDAKVVADPAIFAGMPATAIPEAGTPVGDAARRALRVADGVVVHQYPYQRADLKPDAAREAMVAAMTRRAAWLAQLAGRPVPLYVTEYGWPIIPARGLTAQVQAAQMAATTRALAAMPFVRLAVAYELADSCTDAANVECTFGLYARVPGGVRPKPALAAFRDAVTAR